MAKAESENTKGYGRWFVGASLLGGVTGWGIRGLFLGTFTVWVLLPLLLVCLVAASNPGSIAGTLIFLVIGGLIVLTPGWIGVAHGA